MLESVGLETFRNERTRIVGVVVLGRLALSTINSETLMDFGVFMVSITMMICVYIFASHRSSAHYDILRSEVQSQEPARWRKHRKESVFLPNGKSVTDMTSVESENLLRAAHPDDILRNFGELLISPHPDSGVRCVRAGRLLTRFVFLIS